jgi:glycosyltransferase involved in cell wall biosynthesis
MRILYYSGHPNLNLSSPSGYGTHMREMINAFSKLGHTVDTCIIGGEKLLSLQINIAKPKGLKLIAKKTIPNLVWQTIKDHQLIKKDRQSEKILEEKIMSFKPDLIYERGFYMLTSCVSIAHKHNIKHVLEINSPYNEEKLKFEGRSLYLNKAAKLELYNLFKTDMVVVVSSALKNYFDKKLKFTYNKIFITPNAVDFEKIKVNENEVQSIKTKYNLDDKFIIGFVGSILPHHGVESLIKAYMQLLKYFNTQKFSLFIVGDGETLPTLKQMTMQYRIEEHVVFTGNIPHSEVFNYIQLFDVAVMAKTNWYGSPVKIFEYAALKKPVIAPNVGPVRDVMQNNIDGLLIDNETELLSALEKYIQNAQLRNELSTNFYNKCKSNHQWVNNAALVLDEVEKLRK